MGYCISATNGVCGIFKCEANLVVLTHLGWYSQCWWCLRAPELVLHGYVLEQRRRAGDRHLAHANEAVILEGRGGGAVTVGIPQCTRHGAHGVPDLLAEGHLRGGALAAHLQPGLTYSGFAAFRAAAR